MNAIGLPTQSVDPAGTTTTNLDNVIGDLTTFEADRRRLLANESYPGIGAAPPATHAAGTSFSALETTLTAFDPNGNKVMETVLNGPSGSAALTVTQTGYDPLNRVTCTAERENSAVFASPLPGACVQSANGANGPDHITQLTYDLAGQKLLERRGVGSSIPINYAAYSYSGDGNLLTVLDANTNLTTNTYDGFNRLAQVNYPMPTLGAGASNPNDLESYAYDASGNRTKLTKRDGTAIQFTYDAINRMTRKYFPSALAADDVTYGYDLAGRPASAVFTNISGTPGVSWTYDAAGRRITETTSGYAGATGGLGLSFTYDKAGNRTRITWPDARYVTYAYDGANRFSSVSNAFFDVGAGYDTLSRLNALTRGLNQTSSTAISFDKADRMSQLSHVFTPTSGNEASNIGYTPAGQVASATSTNAAYNWTPVVTPTVATVPDGLNRNASVGGVANSYDANGNLTSDGTRTFAYDKENRLISESGPVTLALAYDPMGRLQQSVINGTTTQFLYDGSALVGEYDGSGNMLRRYVHGPDADTPLVWFESSSMGTANVNYLIADRQGSIITTAPDSGAAATPSIYDPYGVPAAWPTIGSASRFQYTGQIAIPEAQLYYYKARVYDPASGRFLQTDPVGYGPDVNWYAYLGNDPVNGADPTGDCNPHGGCGEWEGEGNRFSGSRLDEEPTLSQREESLEMLLQTLHMYRRPDLDIKGGSGFSNLPLTNDVAEGTRRIAEDKKFNKPERDRELFNFAFITVLTGLTFGDIAVAGIGDAALSAGMEEEGATAAVRCCFAAGTLVETKLGLKPIETIKVGNLVLARDEATGSTTYKPVLALVRPHHRAIFELTLDVTEAGTHHHAAFRVTDDHPWRTLNGRWTQTVSLTPRDEIIRAHGPPARVISVRTTGVFEDTYNLDVAEFHTYFVGRDRLWVHNACDPTELHHITPKYLGGAKNGPVAAIPRSLHRLITNAFRRLALYGKGPRSPEEVEEIMRNVYEQHPLP